MALYNNVLAVNVLANDVALDNNVVLALDNNCECAGCGQRGAGGERACGAGGAMWCWWQTRPWCWWDNNVGLVAPVVLAVDALTVNVPVAELALVNPSAGQKKHRGLSASKQRALDDFKSSWAAQQRGIGCTLHFSPAFKFAWACDSTGSCVAFARDTNNVWLFVDSIVSVRPVYFGVV